MAELDELLRWNRLTTLRPPLLLELPNLSESQSSSLQFAVNRYMTACGCREGKIGILLAVMLCAAYLWIPSGTTWSAFGWPQIGMGVGAVAIGALAGKAIGLLRARIALRQTIQKLQRSLQFGYRFSDKESGR
jgi:hypothetical protein